MTYFLAQTDEVSTTIAWILLLRKLRAEELKLWKVPQLGGEPEFELGILTPWHVISVYPVSSVTTGPPSVLPGKWQILVWKGEHRAGNSGLLSVNQFWFPYYSEDVFRRYQKLSNTATLKCQLVSPLEAFLLCSWTCKRNRGYMIKGATVYMRTCMHVHFVHCVWEVVITFVLKWKFNFVTKFLGILFLCTGPVPAPHARHGPFFPVGSVCLTSAGTSMGEVWSHHSSSLRCACSVCAVSASCKTLWCHTLSQKHLS